MCSVLKKFSPDELKKQHILVIEWWKEHQERDREKEKKEQEQTAKNNAVKSALKKLTPAERRLLGLR